MILQDIILSKRTKGRQRLCLDYWYGLISSANGRSRSIYKEQFAVAGAHTFYMYIKYLVCVRLLVFFRRMISRLY